MTDVKYGIEFFITDKGLIKYIDRATGKMHELGNAAQFLENAFERSNADIAASFAIVSKQIQAQITQSKRAVQEVANRQTATEKATASMANAEAQVAKAKEAVGTADEHALEKLRARVSATERAILTMVRGDQRLLAEKRKLQKAEELAKARQAELEKIQAQAAKTQVENDKRAAASKSFIITQITKVIQSFRRLGTESKKTSADIAKNNKRTASTFTQVASAIGLTTATMHAMNAAGQLAREIFKQLTTEPVRIAADFETKRIQLLQFLGDMKTTRREMARLADFAARTPFELPGILDANRQLLVYGQRALATEGNLRLVGDAAAVSSAGIENLAFWFGRAFSAIQTGAPFDDLLLRMSEFGLRLPGVFERIEILRKLGRPPEEQWALFLTQFERAQGGMERLSQTFSGRVSTMRDNWRLFLLEIGENGALFAAKTILEEIIGIIEKLRNNKQLQVTYAETLADTFYAASQGAIEFGKVVLEVAGFVDKFFKRFNDEGALGYLRDLIDGFRMLLRAASTSNLDLLAEAEQENFREAVRQQIFAMNDLSAKRHQLEKQFRDASAEGRVEQANNTKFAIAQIDLEIAAQKEKIKLLERLPELERAAKDRDLLKQIVGLEGELAEILGAAKEARIRGLKEVLAKQLELASVKEQEIAQLEEERQKLNLTKEEREKAAEAQRHWSEKAIDSLTDVGSRLDKMRSSWKQAAEEARKAEDGVRVNSPEQDPLALNRARDLENYLKLILKLTPSIDKWKKSQEDLARSYSRGSIYFYQYITALGLVQAKIDEASVKQGEKILDSIRTEAEKAKDKITELESVAAALIRSGNYSAAQIDAALNKLKVELGEAIYKSVRQVVDSAIPQNTVLQGQIEKLREYRLEVAQASLAWTVFTGAMTRAPIGDFFAEELGKVQFAITNLKLQIQPMIDWFGALEGSINQVFQGMINGSLNWKDVMKSVLSQVAGDLASFFAKRIQLMWAADTAEDVASKKKVARNSQESYSNLVNAQTGIQKAHSSIPFVGVALALGFIALMMSSLRKGKSESQQVTAFAKGGRVDRPTNALVGEAGTEFIVPKKNFEQIMDELIASRSGSVVSRVGNGSGSAAQNATQASSVQVVFQQSGINFNSERDFMRKIQQVNRVAEIGLSR